MLVKITKIREIINEQFSRLKLHLHINKQNPTSQKKDSLLKLALLFLSVISIISLLILIVGLIQFNGKINSPKKENPSDAILDIEKPEKNPNPKAVQTIFDIKSYVELIEPLDNSSKAGSVNIRESVCNNNIIGSSNWKAVGQIIEGPITQECFGSKWNWYKVKWSNGVIGWSIDNYFQKVEAIKKFAKDGFELEYPFDWKITESHDSPGGLIQILLQKGDSKLIFNTISTSSLIGTINNNQPACVGDLVNIDTKKESYRVNYGYHQSGEKKDKTVYYKYIDKLEFFTRQNPSFEVMYNKYLTKTWDGLSSSDANKMPFIDLFDIQACIKTITPSIDSIYVDLQVKPGIPSSQIIEEADKVVASFRKNNPKTSN